MQRSCKQAAVHGVGFLRQFPWTGPQSVVLTQLRLVCCPSHLIILTAPSIYSFKCARTDQIFRNYTSCQLTAEVSFSCMLFSPQWLKMNFCRFWFVCQCPMTETVMLWQGEACEETMTMPTPLLELCTAVCRGTYCVQRLLLKAELWSHLFMVFTRLHNLSVSVLLVNCS